MTIVQDEETCIFVFNSVDMIHMECDVRRENEQHLLSITSLVMVHPGGPRNTVSVSYWSEVPPERNRTVIFAGERD